MRTLFKGFLTISFSLVFVLASCQKQEKIAPNLTTEQVKGKNKNQTQANYSSASIALANDHYFIAYYNALENFATIPSETLDNVSVTNYDIYHVEYARLVNAYSQNPTQANWEAYLIHIGFTSLVEFNSHSSVVSTAKNELMQNYTYFVGLSPENVALLIEEATEYRFETFARGRKLKKCIQKATATLVSEIDEAETFGDIDEANSHYAQSVKECELKYGPNRG